MIDTTPVHTAVQTAVEGYLSNGLAIAGGLVVAALAVSAVFLYGKLGKRGMNRA